jgi:hypothetical protein
LQLLQEGKKLVLEQIVTTTATVADTVEESFVRYYDLFMPSLKYIMANAVSKEHRLLRGKTIECISLIGLAVGQEKVSECSTAEGGHGTKVGFLNLGLHVSLPGQVVWLPPLGWDW